jgi:hypothetical protein
VFPCVAFALAILVLSLTWMQRNHDPSPLFILGMWFAFGVAADFGFGFYARHKLLTEFRVAATERFVPRPGLLRRIFGGNV